MCDNIFIQAQSLVVNQKCSREKKSSLSYDPVCNLIPIESAVCKLTPIGYMLMLQNKAIGKPLAER